MGEYQHAFEHVARVHRLPAPVPRLRAFRRRGGLLRGGDGEARTAEIRNPAGTLRTRSRRNPLHRRHKLFINFKSLQIYAKLF